MIRTPLSTLLVGLVALASSAACRAQQAGAAPPHADAPVPADDAARDADARAMLMQAQLEAAVRDRDAAREAAKAAREPPVLDAAEVAVKLVRLGPGQATRLADVMLRQARRSFYVRAEDGSVSGPYMNIDNFGDDVLMLHDRKAALPSLEQALAEAIAVSPQPAEADQPLQALQYRPRNETVENLLRALEPFARRIPNFAAADSDGSDGGPMLVSNVTMLEGSGVLVLRDTPAHIAEMTDLLTRLDVPAPQVMLTCLLIQGGSAGEGGDTPADLPESLVRDLHQLLPVTSLSRVGQAALRVAVVPGRDVVLSGTLQTGAQFRLKLKPTGYDRERGTLSVTRCVLSIDDASLFDTSAVLNAGENTVLGASGVQPLFVCLHVAPLDR